MPFLPLLKFVWSIVQQPVIWAVSYIVQKKVEGWFGKDKEKKEEAEPCEKKEEKKEGSDQ